MAECRDILDNEQKCESCLTDNESHSKVATFFCCECMDFLCSDCIGDHSKNEILKFHTVLEKEGELFNTLHAIKELLYCKDHGNLRVYVCEDHSELICEVCIKRSHRCCKKLTKSAISPQDAKESISRLGEKVQESYNKRSSLLVRQMSAAAKQKVLLSELQNFVEESMQRNGRGDVTETSGVGEEEVCTFISNRQDMINVVSTLNDSTKEQIVANYIHLSLKENGSCLYDLKDVEQKTIEAEEFTKKLSLIRPIRNDSFQDALIGAECINVYKDHMQTVETQTDSALDFGHNGVGLDVHSNCSTETSRDTTEKDVGTCAANGKDSPTYSDNVEVADDGHYSPSSGSVPGMVKRAANDISTMTHDVQLVDTESQTNKMDYYKSSTPFLQRDITFAGNYDITHGDEESCRVSGVLVVNNDKIVVADSCNDKLKLFDHHFHLKSVVPTQGKPLSICSITNGRIVVPLATKTVNIYSVANSLQYVSHFKLEYHCRGICTTAANTIALLLSDVPMQDDSGEIQDINSRDDKILIELRNPSNGHILQVIDTFDKELDTPVFIVQDTRGNIVLGEENRLIAFNKHGNREWFYKSYKDVKLEGTLGMDIDKEGNIYVCGETSHNIHQVSCMDYRRNRVIIPYVTNPYSVAFDSFHERLIVGLNGAKYIYVYDFV